MRSVVMSSAYWSSRLIEWAEAVGSTAIMCSVIAFISVPPVSCMITCMFARAAAIPRCIVSPMGPPSMKMSAMPLAIS